MIQKSRSERCERNSYLDRRALAVALVADSIGEVDIKFSTDHDDKKSQDCFLLKDLMRKFLKYGILSLGSLTLVSVLAVASAVSFYRNAWEGAESVPALSEYSAETSRIVRFYYNRDSATSQVVKLSLYRIKVAKNVRFTISERHVIEILWYSLLKIGLSEGELYADLLGRGYYGAKNTEGSVTAGFSAASEYLFKRNFRILAVHETALLLAISVAPFHFDPVGHPERAKEKRDQIIDRIAAAGMISHQASDEEKRQPLL